MRPLDQLPRRDEEGNILVVVESPRGSTVKLKYEPSWCAFTISRPLILGLRYPYDWGFVPSTKAADGDPLDAMVMLDAPTYPGVVVPCRGLGVLNVEQNRSDGKPGRQRNDRLLCAPAQAPRFDHVDDIRQLPERTLKELEQFFLAVVALAGKDVKLLGWNGPEQAERLVDESAVK